MGVAPPRRLPSLAGVPERSYLRERASSYRDLEGSGVRLPFLRLREVPPARLYDDLLDVKADSNPPRRPLHFRLHHPAACRRRPSLRGAHGTRRVDHREGPGVVPPGTLRPVGGSP